MDKRTIRPKFFFQSGGILLILLISSLFSIILAIISQAKSLSDSIVFESETPLLSQNKNFETSNSIKLFNLKNLPENFLEDKFEKNKTLKPFLAVSVDNYINVQPQAGLQSADIVFETLVEGGTTRILAFFKNDPYEVVPVRSTRDYFLDLTKIFNGYQVGAGGSLTALKRAKEQKLPYLNSLESAEFFKRVRFFRSVSDKTRSPESHDGLIKPSFLRSILTERFGFLTPENPIKFQNEKINPKEFRSEKSTEYDITIKFSSISSYDVRYEYVPYLNSYKRLLANSVQTDDLTAKPILVKNVVVLGATITPRNDADGHLDIDLQSGGTAYFFMDGKMVVGKWKSGMKFFDNKGNEVILNHGNTWISILKESDILKVKYNLI
ncbi:MAG: DUF3048 domain-containing protein [Patescibacteria group bacterium]